MRKCNFLLVVVLFSVFGLVFATLSVAGSKGNPRKGKYLFRKNCLTCHAKKPKVKSAAKKLNPSSKKRAEWDNVFQNGNYQKIKCFDKWKKLSDSDINDLHLFLYDHASDSPVPLTCADS